MSRIRLLGGLAAVLVFAVGPSAGAGAALVLSPPTDAPVLDPFRLPDGIYGAGNRGIEYDTGPREPVYAAADGVVAFAGSVAGERFVSIDHPGGLRTTYGFIETALVARGAVVRRGDVVAFTAGPFHFTVRRDGRYLDPATLFGEARTRVRLIPHHADTLLDGPFGPRTIPTGDRRNHWVRATPGRFGVWHEHTTGKESPWQSSP